MKHIEDVQSKYYCNIYHQNIIGIGTANSMIIINYSGCLLSALSKSLKKPVSTICALRACVHAGSNNFSSQDEFLQVFCFYKQVATS